MDGKIAVLAIALLVIAALAPIVALAEPSKTAQYFGKVEIIVSTVQETEINFASSDIIDLLSAAEPPGFHLKEFKVVFEDGMPQGVAPVLFDKKEVENGVIKALISHSGEIKIAPSTFNGTVKAKLISVFVKSKWVALAENVPIDLSSLSGSGLENVTVKFSIDNYAPYAVKALITPDGKNLLSAEAQEEAGAEAIKFDPKHVEFDASAIGFGKYTLQLSAGEEYVLPSAFIVSEDRFENATIPAGATKTVFIKKKAGWKPLGAIVILYSVNPGKLSARVSVEGAMVDLAYWKGEEFEVGGASLMIPPLGMSYWIKAYIVYGDTIKIRNAEPHEIHSIIVPVNIKEIGTWTSKGLMAKVDKKTLKDSVNAYIVVQLPQAATIKSIVLPDGSTISDVADAETNLMGFQRKIVMAAHEALIQVKGGGAEATGDYLFEIEWQPITVKLTDANGNPVVGATVTAEGPVKASAVTGADGTAKLEVYAPGIYHVTATFKGATVADFALGTLRDEPINIQCNVYDLTVTVTTKLGAPIEGAIVTISNEGGFTASAETGADGKAVFAQVPQGTYTVKAEYKGHKKTVKVEVNGNTNANVETDIIADLPWIGPVGVVELAATATAGVATALAVAGVKHGRKEKGEVDEKELEKEIYEEDF